MPNQNTKTSLAIRRHPIAFVKAFITLQAAALLLFYVAKPLAFYKELYNTYVHGRILPFEYDIVFVTLVVVFEIVLTLYTFLYWYAQLYRVENGRASYRRGVFLRKETGVLLTDVRDARVRQGPLGEFGRYGTVRLKRARAGGYFDLQDIPNPAGVAGTIAKLIRTAEGNRGRAESTAVLDIRELLSSTEREGIEFKSTLRWDMKLARINRDLEKAVMKTAAAFLNSEGGKIVIGVGDDRRVVGLDFDYGTIQRKDRDGFENHFTQSFNAFIGPEFRQYLRLHFHQHGGKEVCVVEVEPAAEPAYFAADGKEEFYIRTGNTTTSLKFREANAYVNSRWGART